MIKRYKKNMGGVDLFDQKFTYYHYQYRFIKWWKFLFIYLLEIAINNSFMIFFKLNHDADKLCLNFRQALA